MKSNTYNSQAIDFIEYNRVIHLFDYYNSVSNQFYSVNF